MSKFFVLCFLGWTLVLCVFTYSRVKANANDNVRALTPYVSIVSGDASNPDTFVEGLIKVSTSRPGCTLFHIVPITNNGSTHSLIVVTN